MQLQTFQQQYQNAAMQREALSMQALEMEKTVEELSKAADKDEVFKAVGPVLIKSTKAVLLKEMSERKETLGAHLKSVEAQEKKLREKMAEIQGRLQSMLGTPDHHREPGETEEGESAG